MTDSDNDNNNSYNSNESIFSFSLPFYFHIALFISRQKYACAIERLNVMYEIMGGQWHQLLSNNSNNNNNDKDKDNGKDTDNLDSLRKCPSRVIFSFRSCCRFVPRLQKQL